MGAGPAPEPTIAAGAARALIELAVARGASRRALAEWSGIDPARLDDPGARVPRAHFAALMRAGQLLCDDPALPLHFAESGDVPEVSLACMLGADAAAGGRLALVRSGGELWLADGGRHADDAPELVAAAFARLVCAARRVLGDRPLVRAVHLTHAAPSYRAEYERVFRVPVTFGSDRNALLLADDAWPSRRPPSTPRALLQRLERARSTRERVESLLLPVLHTGAANVDAVAGRLGVSRQTLFRRLKAEGVTFEKVLDELRRRMALDYLAARDASVSRTARLLGYSDPAAFSRAYKRWTGARPRARPQRLA